MLKAEIHNKTYNYSNGNDRLKLNVIVVCEFYCLFTFVSIKKESNIKYKNMFLDEFLVIPSGARYHRAICHVEVPFLGMEKTQNKRENLLIYNTH